MRIFQRISDRVSTSRELGAKQFFCQRQGDLPFVQLHFEYIWKECVSPLRYFELQTYRKTKSHIFRRGFDSELIRIIFSKGL